MIKKNNVPKHKAKLYFPTKSIDYLFHLNDYSFHHEFYLGCDNHKLFPFPSKVEYLWI